VFYLLCASIWIVVVRWELRQNRLNRQRCTFGFLPGGEKALFLVVLWIGVVILSLADIQIDHRLFVNVATLDQSYRVNWIESVLRTGVPPDNSLYLYKHSAPMRNYYFWYVMCAAVARMTHLPARAVFTASCVWAGFGLAALIGLYLKYFLAVGSRLRRQFVGAIALLCVTGLDLCVVSWNLFYLHIAPPADLEAWSQDGILSWLHTLFWAPHHLASMLCCMLAFLLVSTGKAKDHPSRIAGLALIALSLGSAFGLSIYVGFAFFLLMVTWVVWQVAFERSVNPTLLIAGAGCATILLIPYLLELTRSASGPVGTPPATHTPLFSFSVRQMIPPDGLIATRPFQALAYNHRLAAANLAKLLLLAPGYALELGFFGVVLLIYLVPTWRKRIRLSPAQRTLVFLVVAMTPFMSFIRSGILQTNDFAWRAALFVQFALLLLASDLLVHWRLTRDQVGAPMTTPDSRGNAPPWLRSIASVALVIGFFGTICQALAFRLLIPLGDASAPPNGNANARSFSQKAYISAVGYAKLDQAIPQNAVVQFNPEDEAKDRMAAIVNMLGVDHQIAIAGDQGGCGSELGGDPAGCPILAAAIDGLFNGASAQQARTTCRQYGIQYLIARVYDPVWRNKSSWVWTLQPAVSTDDFRAMSCE
jgi:hypothetical protein